MIFPSYSQFPAVHKTCVESSRSRFLSSPSSISDTLPLAVEIFCDDLRSGSLKGKRASHDRPGVDAFSGSFVLVFQLPLIAFVPPSFEFPFSFSSSVFLLSPSRAATTGLFCIMPSPSSSKKTPRKESLFVTNDKYEEPPNDVPGAAPGTARGKR